MPSIGRTKASVSPAIAAAGLLVFVDCVKELPATLLLRPFNFESLSTQLYGEAVRSALGLARPPRLELWLLALDRVEVVPPAQPASR